MDLDHSASKQSSLSQVYLTHKKRDWWKSLSPSVHDYVHPRIPSTKAWHDIYTYTQQLKHTKRTQDQPGAHTPGSQVRCEYLWSRLCITPILVLSDLGCSSILWATTLNLIQISLHHPSNNSNSPTYRQTHTPAHAVSWAVPQNSDSTWART